MPGKRDPGVRRAAGPHGPGTFAHIWTLCVCVLFVGCLADPRDRGVEYDQEPIQLVGFPLHTGDHLGRIVALRYVEGVLAVADLGGAKNLHFVDPETGVLRASLGDVGDGRDQFQAPGALMLDSMGRLWVYDSTNKRSTRIDLTNLTDPTAWAAEVRPMGGEHFFMDVVWTGRDQLIADVALEDGRFGIIAAGGELQGTAGSLPREALDPTTRVSYMVQFAARPDLQRIVATSRWFSKVEILDETAEVVHLADVPVASQPEFEPAGGGFTPAPTSRAVYVDVAATNEHIYALYSGRTEEEFRRFRSYGRDIHVFDWSGRLLHVLRIDRDAFTLEVDAEKGYLFIANPVPDPTIVRYALPDWAGLANGVSTE